MLDKQQCQKFIQNFTTVHRFSILGGKVAIAILLLLAIYGVIYTSSGYLRSVVPPRLHEIGTQSPILYLVIVMSVAFVYERKLICPKCTKRFFGHPKFVTRSRNATCRECGLEIREIEQAAETRIPFATDR